MRALNLTGQRFGLLLVVGDKVVKKSGLRAWLCACDCGGMPIVLAKYLRNGGTRSCGCLTLKRAMAHVEQNTKPIGYERVMKRSGYVEVKTTDGFRRKHIVVMEAHLGRRLAHDEVVHHIDENKAHNALSNLRLMTNGEHTTLHHTGQKRRQEAVDAMQAKARLRSTTKLTERAAASIRALAGAKTQRAIAAEFGVSPMTVSRVVNNQTWKV